MTRWRYAASFEQSCCTAPTGVLDQRRTCKRLRVFFAGFASLPFDERCERIYGKIRADLAQKGTPIGPNDLFIAALAHEAILVTHNTQEFLRVEGLRIEDWEAD